MWIFFSFYAKFFSFITILIKFRQLPLSFPTLACRAGVIFSVFCKIKLLSLIFTAARGIPGRINDRELVTSIWANKTSACHAIPFPLSWTFHQMSSYWVTRCFAVRRCYELAKTEGRMYFAVQFYGECWVSDDKNFMKYGQATNCWEGTGEHWAHYVYKIRE